LLILVAENVRIGTSAGLRACPATLHIALEENNCCDIDCILNKYIQLNAASPFLQQKHENNDVLPFLLVEDFASIFSFNSFMGAVRAL